MNCCNCGFEAVITNCWTLSTDVALTEVDLAALTATTIIHPNNFQTNSQEVLRGFSTNSVPGPRTLLSGTSREESAYLII